MTDTQASEIPKFHNLLISVNVYGVFYQHVSNTAFLQFELSAFKATPRIDFDPTVTTDDNAVFPWLIRLIVQIIFVIFRTFIYVLCAYVCIVFVPAYLFRLW